VAPLLTLLLLVMASGSVIQAPNRCPDVFTVVGPVIFINFPHAVKKERQLRTVKKIFETFS